MKQRGRPRKVDQIVPDIAQLLQLTEEERADERAAKQASIDYIEGLVDAGVWLEEQKRLYELRAKVRQNVLIREQFLKRCEDDAARLFPERRQ
jgi:hypothetical protein